MQTLPSKTEEWRDPIFVAALHRAMVTNEVQGDSQRISLDDRDPNSDEEKDTQYDDVRLGLIDWGFHHT